MRSTMHYWRLKEVENRILLRNMEFHYFEYLDKKFMQNETIQCGDRNSARKRVKIGKYEDASAALLK